MKARFPQLPTWAWPLLALPLVIGVGFWTYLAVAGALHTKLDASLRTMLVSNVSALEQWLESESNLAALMASDPRVRDDVVRLIEIARRTGADPEALKAAPEQAHLREILSPAVSQEGNAGFVVFDPAGLILARIIDPRVGERAVMTVADAVSRAAGGSTVFLAPTTKQKFAAVPMAFLMVPMRDDSGRTFAVFAFRILPQRMVTVLNASHLDETGQTYAVDSDGRMVTESRFAEQAEKMGLLPADAGGRTTAVLEVRDPGTLLVEGRRPGRHRRHGPSRGPPPTWWPDGRG